jgi:hypothetical protein
VDFSRECLADKTEHLEVGVARRGDLDELRVQRDDLASAGHVPDARGVSNLIALAQLLEVTMLITRELEKLSVLPIRPPIAIRWIGVRGVVFRGTEDFARASLLELHHVDFAKLGRHHDHLSGGPDLPTVIAADLSHDSWITNLFHSPSPHSPNSRNIRRLDPPVHR